MFSLFKKNFFLIQSINLSVNYFAFQNGKNNINKNVIFVDHGKKYSVNPAKFSTAKKNIIFSA